MSFLNLSFRRILTFKDKDAKINIASDSNSLFVNSLGEEDNNDVLLDLQKTDNVEEK